MTDENSAKNNSLNKVIIMPPLITNSWEIMLLNAINTVLLQHKRKKHVSVISSCALSRAEQVFCDDAEHILKPFPYLGLELDIHLGDVRIRRVVSHGNNSEGRGGEEAKS